MGYLNNIYELMSNNIIFLAPLAIVVFFITLELIMLFGAGASFLSVFESIVDLDFNVGSEYVSWLGKDKIPSTIWWSIFFISFSITGFMILSLILSDYTVSASIFATIIVALISLFVALVITRYATLIIAKYMPEVESSAISQKDLVGLQCVVLSDTLNNDLAGECKVIDLKGGVHYFMAKPKNKNEKLIKGDKAIIRSYKDNLIIIEKTQK